MAALTGCQRNTAVTGRLKPLDKIGIILASFRMIGWCLAGNELAAAIFSGLVVIIALVVLALAGTVVELALAVEWLWYLLTDVAMVIGLFAVEPFLVAKETVVVLHGMLGNPNLEIRV